MLVPTLRRYKHKHSETLRIANQDMEVAIRTWRLQSGHGGCSQDMEVAVRAWRLQSGKGGRNQGMEVAIRPCILTLLMQVCTKLQCNSTGAAQVGGVEGVSPVT
jgi:hypothetical protein